MAIRVVYIMPNKTPDVIQEAVSWNFGADTLRIWGKSNAKGPMIEIRRDVVFSVEHIKLENDAKKAVEEPEKALEGPKKPKKAPRRAKKRPSAADSEREALRNMPQADPRAV